MRTRYGTELHTPGQSLGKPEIKRYDEDIQAKYTGIVTRRRDLAARHAAVQAEAEHITSELGPLVADGGDWVVAMERLSYLRSEAEAIRAGLDYLSLQAEQLKRVNTWLNQ